MEMKLLKDAEVPLGMLLVQVIYAGMQLLSRVILGQGTFVFALVTYRHMVAAICLVPFALYWERGALRNMSFGIFFWLFMVALTGITMSIGFFYYGLKDTTATYAMNLFNLIPIITFLLSTILRIEKLGLSSRAGKIKAIGAMLCLAGALTTALYKGNSFHFGNYAKHGGKIVVKTMQNRTRGTLFLIASCVSYAMWLILQAKLFNIFPHKYSATMLTCAIASVQSVVIGLFVDRKPQSWLLGWDLQLITIVYSGILATATSFCLILWSISKKGPTYPSMFNPLSLIIIAIAEALLFNEAVYVGSLIGMALIIVGLYSFLLGKNEEIKKSTVLPMKQKNKGGGGDEETNGVVLELVAQQSSIVEVSSEISETRESS